MKVKQSYSTMDSRNIEHPYSPLLSHRYTHESLHNHDDDLDLTWVWSIYTQLTNTLQWKQKGCTDA